MGNPTVSRCNGGFSSRFRAGDRRLVVGVGVDDGSGLTRLPGLNTIPPTPLSHP